MATLTDAQVRASFDQKWDLSVLQARYGAATIMPHVLNKSSMVEESGEIVNITSKPRVVGGDVGADGGFTAEQITLGNVQINVNTWKYVSHIITDKQRKQSIVELQTELPKQFGEKLAEFSDIDLANLFLSLTGGETGVAGQGIGAPGNGATFIEDVPLSAIKQLRRRNIPLDGMSFIISPEAFYDGWLTKERMTSANQTGNSKSLLETGVGYGKSFKQMILGVPAFESTLLNGTSAVNDLGAGLNPASGVNLPGTTACALIHEESLGIAMQINSKVETVRTTPAGQLATLVVANNLYGFRIVRANHGIVIYVKN